MSRARNIKPGFFKNEILVELAFEHRLLFVGLWTMADREGRLEDRPTKIKMELFPADSVDVDGGLQALHDNGFVQRYEADGKRFIQVLAWGKHQNPHMKEAKSMIPAPGEHGASTVQAPTKADTSPADSLIPDSGFSDSKGTSTAQQAARGVGVARKAKVKTSTGFERFWAAYPVKKGKADAERHWKTQGLDPLTDLIIAHVQRMQAEDDQWRRRFIPHGSTYVCGKHWQDEPVAAPIEGKTPAPAPSPQSFGPKAAMRESETPLERALGYAKQRYERGEFGTGSEALIAYQAECQKQTQKHRSMQ